MAIKGLTDKEAQFPCIGELRKGEKKPDDAHIGKDLNEHFRFTSKDPDVAAEFANVYGNLPTSIHVYLPFATKDEVFEAWQEEWVAGGLRHRCDGETCVLWYNDVTKKYSKEPKPCPGKCKQVGRLRVIIPELKRLAYVTVLTTSVNDIINLTQNLLAYESLRKDLRGIPFILHRTKHIISTPSGKDGKRARREKWLLTIEPVPQWVELQIAAQHQAATPLLQAGGEMVDGDTGEIVGETPDFDDDVAPAGDFNDEPDLDEVFGEEEEIPDFPHDQLGFLTAVNKYMDEHEKNRYDSIGSLANKLKEIGRKSWPASTDNQAWDDCWRCATGEDLPF